MSSPQHPLFVKEVFQHFGPESGDPTLANIPATEDGASQFATRLSTVVPTLPVENITLQQHATIDRLSATEASLRSFNSYSASRFEAASARIEAHANLLKTMKSDLDSVFKRLRTIKAKLAKKYPEQYGVASERASATRLDLDDDED